MNTWNNIISACVPILCLLITAGGAYLVALLKRETMKIEQQLNNETAAKYIDMANDAVAASVMYVTQTYVETLKKAGGFTKEKQIEAFNMAKERVFEILSDTAVKALNEIYGDLDAFLQAKIEEIIYQSKKPIDQIIETSAQ